jgi:predicted aminopeptidase
MTYVFKQASAQLDLEVKGRLNEDVLTDKKVKEEHKKKIKQILKYKSFFYDYFKIEPTTIYDKTTFLESEAVTYLVVASKKNEIKALEHDFPIVGKFPYIGFFSKKDAKEFADELKEQGYDTYVRNVYAYSTLDQLFFKDNILSSFFVLNNEELAELIFHELFHTIFFIEDEVELNENMAQFFSYKLVKLYYKEQPDVLNDYLKRKSKAKKLHLKISQLVKDLAKKYKNIEDGHVELRKKFLKETFNPQIQAKCDELALEECWPIKRDWNNASFVSFLTYESSQTKIEKYFYSKETNPRSFYKYLLKRYKKFKKKKIDSSFKDYLLKDK